MKCPKCQSVLEVDYTPDCGENMPWGVSCFACGWFLSRRFETVEEAEKIIREG